MKDVTDDFRNGTGIFEQKGKKKTESALKRLLAEFVGERVELDTNGAGYLWGVDEVGNIQMIGDVRGWGAVQKLFTGKDGKVDFNKAEEFYEYLGKFIAEAITEKLQREKVC
jgi:hypothetical protein